MKHTDRPIRPRRRAVWFIVSSLLPLLLGTVALPRVARAGATTATAATDFLNSLGADSSNPSRGQPVDKTVAMVQYAGLRWLRGGVDDSMPMDQVIALHQATGVRFCCGVSGGADLKKVMDTARAVAQAGALLAFEGPNEPNNWGFIYKHHFGGKDKTWVPVAEFQRDLYQAVKNDPVHRKYPVWSLTEGGAEVDNVGLQFLTIPPGAGTVMPAGTVYADYATAGQLHLRGIKGLAPRLRFCAARVKESRV